MAHSGMNIISSQKQSKPSRLQSPCERELITWLPTKILHFSVSLEGRFSEPDRGGSWDWLCQGEEAENGAKEDFKIRAVSTCINSLALKKLQWDSGTGSYCC